MANVVFFVFSLISAVRFVRDGGLLDNFDMFVLATPVINCIALGAKPFGLSVAIVLLAILLTSIALCLAIFMIIWPLGHLGDGLDLFLFWAIFATIILTDTILYFRFIEGVKSLFAQKNP